MPNFKENEVELCFRPKNLFFVKKNNEIQIWSNEICTTFQLNQRNLALIEYNKKRWN